MRRRDWSPAPGQQDLFSRGLKWKRLNELALPPVVRLGPGSSISASKVIAVLRCLQSFAKDQTTCWPSARTIAEATRMSIPTVRRALRAAELLGLVIRRPRRADGRQASNHLQLVWSNFSPEESVDQASPDPSAEAPETPASRPEQVIRVISPGDHGDRPGDHGDQGENSSMNSKNLRPAGAGGGEFFFLGEVAKADVATVEGVDRLFRRIVRKGGFGFRDRLRDRFEFHALFASVVRAYQAGEVRSPVGCFLARIRRGRAHWRSFIRRGDRRKVRQLWREAAVSRNH